MTAAVPYTDEEDGRLKRLYFEGATMKRISLEMGRSVLSVVSRIHRLRIGNRRHAVHDRIAFRLTSQEREILAKRAMTQGKTLSGYMRALVRRELAA